MNHSLDNIQNTFWLYHLFNKLEDLFLGMKRKQAQFESIFSTRTSLTRERSSFIKKIIKTLFLNPLSLEFREPLDWQGQGLINYDTIIQKPMDLRTVQQNFKRELYHSVQECLDDIELIFQNSFCYNKGNEWIEDLTEKCEKAFLKLVRNYFPEVKLKAQPESKKSLKKSKKQEKSKNPNIKKNNSIQVSESNIKFQNPSEQASTSILPPNQTQTKDQEQLSKIKEQLFDLIREASQKSLQIFYLIIKNQDTSTISTERNGNCSIDVKKLSKQLINRLIDFLKNQKERQKFDANKVQNNKRKRKLIPEKSRYEI